jgi:hypothetical protein
MRRSLPVRASGDPTDRHAAAVEALRRAVFESPGSTEPAVRAAAGTGSELPDPVGSYASLVRDQSYTSLTPTWLGSARPGLSDDDMFEVTVAAAVGAALRRLDAGIRAVRGTA